MELKEFVRSALVEISEGILSAQIEASHLVAIAPGTVDSKPQDQVTDVEFDIAVVVSKSKGASRSKDGKMEGSIQVFDFSLGGSASEKKTANKSEAHKEVSRIRFKVPVKLSSWFREDDRILPETENRLAARDRRRDLVEKFRG